MGSTGSWLQAQLGRATIPDRRAALEVGEAAVAGVVGRLQFGHRELAQALAEREDAPSWRKALGRCNSSSPAAAARSIVQVAVDPDCAR